MTDHKRTRREANRRPGMRRILDGMRQIEEESPGLIDEAVKASFELAKRRRGDGGRMPQ